MFWVFFIRGAMSFLVDMVEGCRVSIGRNYFPLLIHGFKLMIKLTKIRCIDSCKKKKKDAYFTGESKK